MHSIRGVDTGSFLGKYNVTEDKGIHQFENIKGYRRKSRNIPLYG